MKKTIKYLSFICLITTMVVASCGEQGDDFDMCSPQAAIPVDTFEIARGGTVNLKATLTDESGLASYALTYSNWKINKEELLKESGSPNSYEFTANIVIPTDADYSWEENYQKNDGTIFKITQTYHKLSLTFYDAVRNKNVVYFYIKVIP